MCQGGKGIIALELYKKPYNYGLKIWDSWYDCTGFPARRDVGLSPVWVNKKGKNSMPTLYYHVDGAGVGIMKTVTDQVVMGLLSELDVTQYVENSIYILTPFTASSNFDDGTGSVNLVKNRADVEVHYTYDPGQVPWPTPAPYNTPAYGLRSTVKGNHSPILVDQDAGIMIEQYTTANAVELNFTLTFQTYDTAMRVTDTLRTKYHGNLIQKPFNLLFSYPVSMGLYEFLYSVYKARVGYTTKTLFDYINDMKTTQISFDVRKSQLTDPNADHSLMVRVAQLNCIGQLTMDQKEPEVTRDHALPLSYNVSFTYALQFGRPTMLAVNTPVSVDNTPLPYALFATAQVNIHDTPYVGGVYSDLMVSDTMKRSYGNFDNAARIIRIPIYDDWFCPDRTYQVYKYKPLLIAHFTLDGPSTTINLKQLDDVQLHPIVQTILAKTGNSVFQYGGLFNIGVYAGAMRLGPELVSLDADLNLTILSGRTDQVYHLMISETTDLQLVDPQWNPILIQYRYFFPLTIERNLQTLVGKGYFKIAYDDSVLELITTLNTRGVLKPLLVQMVTDGECTNEIFSYTQNVSQLADYLALTESLVTNYVIPTGTDSVSVLIQTYYTSYASVDGRSLLIVFLEQCLRNGTVTLATLPGQYIQPSQTVFPYTQVNGGFYGFNTPIRVLNYNIRAQRRPQ